MSRSDNTMPLVIKMAYRQGVPTQGLTLCEIDDELDWDLHINCDACQLSTGVIAGLSKVMRQQRHRQARPRQ